jgi:hypothetical protein
VSLYYACIVPASYPVFVCYLLGQVRLTVWRVSLRDTAVPHTGGCALHKVDGNDTEEGRAAVDTLQRHHFTATKHFLVL